MTEKQVPSEKSNTKAPPKVLTGSQLFFRATLLAIGIAAVMLLITALGVGAWGYGKLRTFLRAAEISSQELRETVQTGWEMTPQQTDNHKNILVLGLDSLEGRGDIPALTDTMMLVSLDFEDGSVTTLPLPRDLWNEAYQTKINALYHYGQDKSPDNPARFPEEVIESMTNLEIHHTLVISLDQLQTLIDMVGGVEIEVTEGFTDEEFPRANIDVAVERDPAVLYETVHFEAGKQIMDGETALKYIRSRKSAGDQGTDQARGARQQQVISALATKLISIRNYFGQPALAGELFKYYQESFAESLPLTELIATARSLWPFRETLSLTSQQLTTTLVDGPGSVLDNPRPSPYRYQNQWVYVVTDTEKFQAEVKEKLQ